MIFSRVYLATTIIALTSTLISQAVTAEPVHVRLRDRLDRPADGYCLDILGTGSNLLLDVPLFAHNCKSGPTPDSTVIYTDSGQLQLRGHDLCLAVGEQSSQTYSPSDRWRVLSLQSCDGVASGYSSWEMVPLNR